MLIYCNGDSYTDGAGLGDPVMFPKEYPGIFKNYPDNQGIRKWMDRRAVLVSSKLVDSSLKIENRKRCWATHLGKILGAEVINEGVGGSSMFGILTRTIHDLELLSKENRIPDAVIIGLTTPERIPIINTQFPSELIDDFWVHTAHPSYTDHLAPRYRKYVEEFWMSHSDTEMLIFFFYECLHIKHYVKLKTGKDPIFMNTSNVFAKDLITVKNSNLPILKEVWNLIGGDEIASQKSFIDIAKDFGFLACGHFTEDANIEYAKYIAKMYFNTVDTPKE